MQQAFDEFMRGHAFNYCGMGMWKSWRISSAMPSISISDMLFSGGFQHFGPKIPEGLQISSCAFQVLFIGLANGSPFNTRRTAAA